MCKVNVSETELTIYIEVGEEISLMDDQRRTQVYEIAADSIGSLTYREDESVNSDRLVRNTFLFGILGAAFTKPDKVAQVEIGFTESEVVAIEPVGLVPQPVPNVEGIDDAESEAVATEPVDLVPQTTPNAEEIEAEGVDDPVTESVPSEPEEARPVISSSLVFETGRSSGAELRDTLESLTGLTARLGI